MVPNLRPGVGLTADEDAGHDIFGQIRFHSACVEIFHQHQHHQRHIQRDIPGQPRSAIDVFARCRPPPAHHLEERRPWQGALALKQWVVVVHVDRNSFAIFGCSWAVPSRTMALFVHDVLLR